MRSAYEWGLARRPKPSCGGALAWRESLGPGATQADAWLACRRGDWLLWQLEHGLTREQYKSVWPAIHRALEAIVKRAIRRGIKSLVGVRAPWATQWRKWANRWLRGEDRFAESAAAAARGSRITRAESVTKSAADGAQATATAEEAVSIVVRAATAEGVARGRVAEVATEAPVEVRDHECALQARDIRREIPEWIWE